MSSENKDEWNEELIVEFIGGTVIDLKVSLAWVIDVAQKKEITVTMPTDSVRKCKKGDLLLLKGKTVEFKKEYGFASMGCEKIYTDKVRYILE
jgi:hypothetical protein